LRLQSTGRVRVHLIHLLGLNSHPRHVARPGQRDRAADDVSSPTLGQRGIRGLGAVPPCTSSFVPTCSGTVLIAVDCIAVVPRRRFTRESHAPSPKGPLRPRSVAFSWARSVSGAEPNATFEVGADGETGDFKGLTLSNSKPRPLRKAGLLFESRPSPEHMSTTRTQFTFRVDTWTPHSESIVEHVAGVEDLGSRCANSGISWSLPECHRPV
jgi:hypothetical protein